MNFFLRISDPFSIKCDNSYSKYLLNSCNMPDAVVGGGNKTGGNVIVALKEIVFW
jgi:hypothetical protein